MLFVMYITLINMCMGTIYIYIGTAWLAQDPRACQLLPPGGLLRGATLLGNGLGLWVHPGPEGVHNCLAAGATLVSGVWWGVLIGRGVF